MFWINIPDPWVIQVLRYNIESNYFCVLFGDRCVRENILAVFYFENLLSMEHIVRPWRRVFSIAFVHTSNNVSCCTAYLIPLHLSNKSSIILSTSSDNLNNISFWIHLLLHWFFWTIISLAGSWKIIRGDLSDIICFRLKMILNGFMNMCP